jgi:hypothetical protein
MKLSVSLQLQDLEQSVGAISMSQGLYLFINTGSAHTTQTLNIHTLSEIRTHGPDVRVSEDSLATVTGRREMLLWEYTARNTAVI